MDQDLLDGRVIAVDASGVLVDVGAEELFCRVRGRFYEDRAGQKRPIAPGDRVRVMKTATGEGSVEEILPREGKLSRRMTETNLEQVIAANVDQVGIVVATKNPPLRPGLVDRILVASTLQGLTPFVVLNKIDLGLPPLARDLVRTYERLGYQVLPTSTANGEGIEELVRVLEGKTTVVTGHSGVGKSSLLNAVQPGLGLKVGKVSHSTQKGRHTTTRARLFRLKAGGYVVDTPGIRSFGLLDIEKADLDIFFCEFQPFIEMCRFHDCSHTHEPRCAVRDAVTAGEIDLARYETYVRILETLTE